MGRCDRWWAMKMPALAADIVRRGLNARQAEALVARPRDTSSKQSAAAPIDVDMRLRRKRKRRLA